MGGGVGKEERHATEKFVFFLQMKKGFKVTDKKRSKLVGVGCDSLSELVEKGRKKLSIAEDVVVALNDGTIVDDDDYFLNLPPQTILIFYRKNENILTGESLFFLTIIIRKKGVGSNRGVGREGGA